MPETRSGLHYVMHDLRPPWRTTGTPVVFHHGIGTNLGIWAAWVPIIAARYPVILFDMRGFGRSPVPREDYAWSMREMVADFWEVAERSGAGRVHIVGESMGGTIALAAAAELPRRTASVSILNATYKGDGVGELGAWHKQFDTGDASGWSRRMMENRYAPGAGDSDALAWFEREQAKTVPHVAMGLGALLARTDLGDCLARLDVPLSITLPDESPFVPVEHGAELARIVKNSCLRVVHGVRHGLPFSHARQEALYLLDTLDTLEALAGRD